LNALSIKGGDPVSPRGKTPDDKQAGITIKTDIAAQPQ